MKFKINDREWEIKEVTQEELRNVHNDNTGEGCYYGTTFPNTKEIWLWKDLPLDTKRKTLYHELMHCYIFSYISFNNIPFEIDDFCDISANAHNKIQKISDDYFRGRKK